MINFRINMENTCFNCSITIPLGENIFYCPSCMTQVKCKKCTAELLKGAIGCVACGTKIESVFIESNTSALNQIEFDQKGDSKKFKATFTNEVGHDMVATFGGMVGMNLPKKKTLFSLSQGKNFDPLEIGVSNSDIEDIDFTDDSELSDALNRVFKIDGDILIFQTTNFKTRSKLNIEKRIALLTLLGYKLIHNTEEIKRQLLTDILKKFKYNSASFRTWIGKSEEIGQKSGRMIFLTPNGLETAIEVLKDVTNPNITESKIKLSIGSGNPKKKSSDNSGDRKSTKSPKESILQLIQEDFFSQKKTVSDISKYLKVNKASTFSTTVISVAMVRLLNTNGLKREQGSNGYEYFI